MPNSICSPRARGANSIMAVKFETAYGTPPSGNYMQLPFVSHSLGEEFGLPIGTNVEGKMVTALRRLGFDKVVLDADDCFPQLFQPVRDCNNGFLVIRSANVGRLDAG